PWLSPIDRWRLLRRESADCRATWNANVRRTAAVPGRAWPAGELGEGDRQPWCGGGKRAPGSEHPGYRCCWCFDGGRAIVADDTVAGRSEERRVGKECWPRREPT